MQESKLEVKTADGVCDCRLYQPDGKGPFPAVLFYQDGVGVRPELEQMAGRLAQEGYFVFFPNLFYRAGNYAPFNAATVWTDAPERARLGSIIQPASRGAMADTRIFLETIAQQPGARAGRIGVVGYCIGGRLALVAAETYPEQIAAAASIHPGGLVSDQPDSPHLAVARARARLYFGIADEDPSCTPAQQGQLEQALKAAGTRYQLELHRGARHGFAVPGTPVYHPEAAGQHWQRLLALFKDELPRA